MSGTGSLIAAAMVPADTRVIGIQRDAGRSYVQDSHMYVTLVLLFDIDTYLTLFANPCFLPTASVTRGCSRHWLRVTWRRTTST